MVVTLSSVSWELKGYECEYFGVSPFLSSFFFNTKIQLSCVFKTKKKELYSTTNLENWFRMSIEFMYHIKQSQLDLQLDF